MILVVIVVVVSLTAFAFLDQTLNPMSIVCCPCVKVAGSPFFDGLSSRV